jgi:hypothetical protein
MKRIEGVRFQRQDHPNLNTTAGLIVPLLVSLTHSHIARGLALERSQHFACAWFCSTAKTRPRNT